ncbi:pentatricopeptide repeat-containing protein At3g02650, mitochondrial [Salvia miltiorrhiza]|uniref:pentatricopeptide repeat-containing protein At3g02650, mitochondrial n=1 Tax=Salvia miltiorrhiza TaxID=226208 RepID=UPI0025AB745C|nr:pentatricopeptide repeat-containing protein At3g02650, mitochondrial [Salvia miltiorrhiza]
MWRPLARRALLYRRTSLPRKLHLPVNLQVANRPPPLTHESASRLSFFSSTYHFHQNPRFFSSDSAEIRDDLPPEPLISEDNETTGGFDFSGLNESGGFEDEDSIFDGATETPDVNHGFGELFGESVAFGENMDSAEEGVGLVEENDAENVESLLSLLQSSDVVHGSIIPHLERMNLTLDNDLVMKVLQTPCVSGENLIGFLRWVLKKWRFKLTSEVLNELVRSICTRNRRREVYALWDLINEVAEKEKGVVSSECLNEVIAELSKLGKGKAAFEVFNKFEEFGCASNADTYYLTIEALCKRSFYNWAWSVCEKMLTADKLPDAGKVGKIISYLCKGGMGKDAHLVYLYAKDKKINLPRSCMNIVVSSLCRLEKTNKETYEEINKELDRETVSSALEMLGEYSAEDRKYAIKPYSSVIKKLCWIEDVERAKKLLLEMIEFGPPPGNSAFNFVINGLTKSENMEEALSMMKLMESRGLRPDVYTYCVIMSGLVKAGEMDEACKILDEAKKKHSKLTPVAYHTLIRGFCRLEQFDKAVNLLGEMRQHGVQPQHDEYNKLIKSLCFKALDWETAEKLHEDMNANGIVLNGRTKALIAAVKDLQEVAGAETAETTASA